jgi:hypothetical protein
MQEPNPAEPALILSRILKLYSCIRALTRQEKIESWKN